MSIFNIKDMELIHRMAELPANPSGICSLAASVRPDAATAAESNYFAYPGSATNGDVLIFDTGNVVCAAPIYYDPRMLTLVCTAARDPDQCPHHAGGMPGILRRRQAASDGLWKGDDDANADK